MRRFVGIMIAVLIAILAFPATGCGSSAGRSAVAPTAQPLPRAAVQVPAGWKVYQNSANGFSIALPPSWEAAEVDSADMAEGWEALVKKNPGMALLGKKPRGLSWSSGIAFLGFDSDPGAGTPDFANNVNVKKDVWAKEDSLDTYLTVELGALEKQIGALQPIARKRVNVGAGPAVEWKYNFRLVTDGGDSITLFAMQYIAVKGKATYNTSLVAISTQASKYQPIFEDIGRTFNLLD